MKIKEITLSRSRKWGQYNKESATMSVTFDGEQDIDKIWEYINQQLALQMNLDGDPAWIAEEDKNKKLPFK